MEQLHDLPILLKWNSIMQIFNCPRRLVKVSGVTSKTAKKRLLQQLPWLVPPLVPSFRIIGLGIARRICTYSFKFDFIEKFAFIVFFDVRLVRRNILEAQHWRFYQTHIKKVISGKEIRLGRLDLMF